MNSLLTHMSIPFTKDQPAEAFSRATLEHAVMKFDQSLDEFCDATKAFESKPTFQLAVDLCLASRTAWLKAFPEWRCAEDAIAPAIVRLRDSLEKAAKLLSQFRQKVEDKKLREKLDQFTANVIWRFEMAKVLADTPVPPEVRQAKIIELEILHGQK